MLELSELDKAILTELTSNPFASNAEVASVLGIEMSAAAHRIRALESKNVSRILAVLSLSHLNQRLCFLYVNVRDRLVRSVAEEIAKRSSVLMVSELYGGAHELFVLLKYSDFEALNYCLDEDLNHIHGIRDWRVDFIIDKPVSRNEYVTFLPDYFSLSPEKNLACLTKDVPAGLCDDSDLRIIAQLQYNAHQSISKMSRMLDIKPGTIRYRIKNLENSGMLRFIRVVDSAAIGVTTFTLLEMKVKVSQIKGVVRLLQERRWLPQLYRCSGSAHLVGIILTDSVDQVLRVKEELLNIDGVSHVKLSHINKTYKNDYRWIQKIDRNT